MYILPSPSMTEIVDECVENSFARTFEFFLNKAHLSMNSVNSANFSENLRNHWSMNWLEFKDPLCYLCLPGAEVECWFLTQEIVISNPPFAKIFFKFCRFFEVDLGKIRITPILTFSKLNNAPDLTYLWCSLAARNLILANRSKSAKAQEKLENIFNTPG